ncbi:MAG: hypothetical protein U1E87_00215 [Alphaproteobacteria bacterium]
MGEPQLVDTSRDPRLSRIFFNRTIKRYPTFEGFFGMEDTIERIVGYFKHAAQGLLRRAPPNSPPSARSAAAASPRSPGA